MNSKKAERLSLPRRKRCANRLDVVTLGFRMAQVFSLIEICRGDTAIFDDEKSSVLEDWGRPNKALHLTTIRFAVAVR